MADLVEPLKKARVDLDRAIQLITLRQARREKLGRWRRLHRNRDDARGGVSLDRRMRRPDLRRHQELGTLDPADKPGRARPGLSLSIYIQLH